jgi:hypothetical protein
MNKLVPIILIVLNYYFRFYLSCHAKKIDSYDLLIGEWDTKISFRQGRWAEMFSSSNKDSKNILVNPISSSLDPCEDGKKQQLQQHRKGRRLKRSYPCRLALYHNGTFGLISQQGHRPTNRIMCNNPAEASSPQICVRGRWMVQINPYCVTDRFYDNLVLESYPRVQKRIVVSDENDIDGKCGNTSGRRSALIRTEEAEVLQKVRLKLHCRLSGHFTGRRLRFRDRHCYARGKLTHGIVLLDRITDDAIGGTNNSHPQRSSWWTMIAPCRRRPGIVASFSAQRLIPSWRDVMSQSNDYDDLDKERDRFRDGILFSENSPTSFYK